jgi:uncharacterized protein (DUF2147 family)
MKMLIVGIISMMLFVSTPTNKTVVGKWKTIDDETHQPKSVVNLVIKNDKLYGNIIKLYRKKGEDLDPLCTKCTGSLNNKKIIGMQIVNGLTKDDNEWEGDNGILDPNNGKYYDCKIWLDPSNPDILNVRGYIGFIYRTQTWHRVE